jgi:hypothetical protein
MSWRGSRPQRIDALNQCGLGEIASKAGDLGLDPKNTAECSGIGFGPLLRAERKSSPAAAPSETLNPENARCRRGQVQ